MSDTVAVKRNDIELPLTEFKIIRGKNKDKKYLAPTVTGSGLDTFIRWFGIDNAANTLQTFVKRAFQLVHKECIGADGTLDMAKFLAAVADFTSRGLTISELQDQYEELVEQQQANIEKLGVAEPGTPDFVSLLTSIKEQKGRILGLKEMIENKSRKKAETGEDETVEASVAAS